MRSLHARLGLAVVLAALLAGSATWAVPYPGYVMSIEAGDDVIQLGSLIEGVDYSWVPIQDENGYVIGGTYQLLGAVADDDVLDPAYLITSWSSGFDVEPFVTNNVSVTNPSASPQSYVFTVTSPVSPALGSTTMDGSIGITVTNTTGTAAASSTSPNAIYIARLDGGSVQTLFNHSSSVGCATPFCTTTQNASFGPVGGPGVTTNMGIDIRFTLSPGDSVSITSTFNIVPEPTPLMLLGVGLVGLVIAGRRRRRPQ